MLCLSSVTESLLEMKTCSALFLQIDPNSIAAKDGRIREGDRIIQVMMNILNTYKELYNNILCMTISEPNSDSIPLLLHLDQWN